MWIRWTMFNKMNEMEINNGMNEIDFGILNESDESYQANV